MLSTTLGGMGDPALSLPLAREGGVVARLSTDADDLEKWLDRWCEHRSARARPRGVKAYRAVVDAGKSACGWRVPRDLLPNPEDPEHRGAVEYMDGKRHSKDWSGRTYNHHRLIFRDLIKFLMRRGALTADPFEEVGRVPEDKGLGARAATLDEARKYVAHIYARECIDKRRKYGCALYRALEFTMGLRDGEAYLWQWKHLLLDEPVPFINWTPDIQKNHRHEPTAIGPEPLRLLRMHRDIMRQMAAACPFVWVIRRRGENKGKEKRVIDPANPEGYVFPFKPAAATMRQDRTKAGVAGADARGAHWSAHSARKCFRTTLRQLGVERDTIDRLMRHDPEISQLYDEVSLAEQAQALARYPEVWPTKKVGEDSSGMGLTVESSSGIHFNGDSANQFQSDPRSRPGALDPQQSHRFAKGRAPSHEGGSLRGQVGQGIKHPGRVESPAMINQTSPNVRLIIEVDPNSAVELLDTLARLLRRESGDGSGTRSA